MAESGSLDSAFRATPGHHNSIQRGLSLQDFVPTDHPPSVFFQELSYTFCDITLEQLLSRVVSVGLDAKSLDPCLALMTGFPTVLRTLVAAYVNIFIREDIHNLSQDILNELIGLLVSGA